MASIKEQNDQTRERLKVAVAEKEKEANDARSRMGAAANRREYRRAQDDMWRAEAERREHDARLRDMGGHEVDPEKFRSDESRRREAEARGVEAWHETRQEAADRNDFYRRVSQNSEQGKESRAEQTAYIERPSHQPEQPTHAPPGGGGWGVGAALGVSLAARRLEEARKRREEEKAAEEAARKSQADNAERMKSESEAHRRSTEAQPSRDRGDREQDGHASKGRESRERRDDRERDR